MSYTPTPDVECPYCGAGQEINHDDGYGFGEDETHEQYCSDCGKTFTYTTSISYYYEAEKAPCKNGGEHAWKPIVGCPPEMFVGRTRCSYCGDELTDVEANKKSMDDYFDALEKEKVMGKKKGKMSRSHKRKQREYYLDDQEFNKQQAEFRETERKLWQHFLWCRLVPIAIVFITSAIVVIKIKGLN